jgi:hypothetical protein
MPRTFPFNAQGVCQSTGVTFDALCISYDKGTVESLQFFSDLEAAIKNSQLLPDCIIVIADAKLAKELHNFWISEVNQRNQIVTRGKKKDRHFIKSYYFYAWNASKRQLQLEESDTSSDTRFVISIEKLLAQGLQTLLSQNEVLQIAPAGHVFRHPSGTTVNKVFIQAREMAKNEPELCFIAKAIGGFKGELLKAAKVVFIDTMGIYHIVKKALNAVESAARIESFHSYTELEKIYPPSDSDYVCIISASTSGGMARKLVEKQNFDSSRIVTLIDITDKDRYGSVLIPLDSVGSIYKNLLDDGTETEIELVGEHFSSKAKPPRPVTLGKPHQPKLSKEILRHFGKDGLKNFNSKFYDDATETKLICLNPFNIINNKIFIEWLNSELAWSIPLAIDHVIHTNDQISEQIAKLAISEIKLIRNIETNIPLISQKDLHQENIKEAKGILVITAVAGDGSAMREISRDLREYAAPNVPRHFLIAIGLPQTEVAWSRLRQFLERNPTERKYGFSNWLMLPIGYDGKDTAWEQLANLAQKAEVANFSIEGVEQAVINESLSKLAIVISNNQQSFLPTNSGNKLALTDGYVFFEDLFSEAELKKIPESTVYLSIAAVLQSAREIKDKNIRLASTGYESVVLDPECFLRFNDNILQACLLRACHASELDYSASPHLSKLMKEFLVKIFTRHAHAYGDAALEFAAALSTGRMKLKKEDCETLLKMMITLLKDEASPLLGFLLIAINGQ